jgi:putative sterol carrier protein
MADSAREFFETLGSRVDPKQTAGLTSSYLFDIEGVGWWRINLDDGELTVTEGESDAEATLAVSEQNLLKMHRRQLAPMKAVVTRRMKVKGNIAAALQLEKFLR